MDEEQLSFVVRRFDADQWDTFVHEYLQLEDQYTDELEQEYQDNFEQLKRETVKKWAEVKPIREENAIPELRKLRHDYFCGRAEMDPAGEITDQYSEQAELATTAASSSQSDSDSDGPLAEESAYQLNGKKGYVLIISNSKDSEHSAAERMKTLWLDVFECVLFKGKVQRNRTASQMRSLLEKFAEQRTSGAYMVIAITTDFMKPEKESITEQEEYLTGSDGKVLPLNQIKKIFGNRHTNLRNVPKLFIYGGCSGAPFIAKMDERETKVNYQPKPDSKKTLIPSISDSLVIYPPIKQMNDSAEFDEENSVFSWFNNAVIEVFRDCGKVKHVVEIATELNRKWADSSLVESSTSYLSTLTRKFYLVEEAVPMRLRTKQGPKDSKN